MVHSRAYLEALVDKYANLPAEVIGQDMHLVLQHLVKERKRLWLDLAEAEDRLDRLAETLPVDIDELS